MSRHLLVPGLVLAGTAVAIAGLALGTWWLTFAAAVVVGAVIGRPGRALLTGSAIGLLGWSAALLWEDAAHPLGRAADVLAGVMGFGSLGGWVPALLTVLTGVVMGLAGAWLGSAGRLLASGEADDRG